MKKIDGEKTLSIYCVYHDKSKIKENKLMDIDQDLYELYYTKEGHPGSFDKIQEYINEFTAQAYVLRNNKKTDYIGFCHYRRILNLKDMNKVLNYKVMGFDLYTESWANFENIRFRGFLKNDLEEFIVNNYPENSRPYRYFIIEKYNRIKYFINELYITTWDIFSEMVDFISRFLDFIDKKYALNYDPDKYHNFILTEFIDRKLTHGIENNETWWFENSCKNFWRVIATYIELMVGIWLGNVVLEK